MPVSKPVKTLNGRPTRTTELAVPVNEDDDSKQAGFFAKLKRGYKNLNLILAGMYTGVTCYGVPHEEHTYNAEKAEEKFEDKLP